MPDGSGESFQVGERVALSRTFLQSTGQYTGSVPFLRGRITELQQLGRVVLATVQWENAGEDDPNPQKVVVENLVRVTEERGVEDRY